MQLVVSPIGIAVLGVYACLPTTHQQGKSRRVYFWYKDPFGTTSREILSINLDTERVHRGAKLRHESLKNIEVAVRMFKILRKEIERNWRLRHGKK